MALSGYRLKQQELETLARQLIARVKAGVERVEGDVVCPECGAKIVARSFIPHVRLNHWPAPENPKWWHMYRSVAEKQLVQGKMESSALPRFKIISKRGTKIYEHFSCAICKAFTTSGWYYRETTWGEVRICHVCKDCYRPTRVPFKSTLKTAFESSRKRH